MKTLTISQKKQIEKLKNQKLNKQIFIFIISISAIAILLTSLNIIKLY